MPHFLATFWIQVLSPPPWTSKKSELITLVIRNFSHIGFWTVHFSTKLCRGVGKHSTFFKWISQYPESNITRRPGSLTLVSISPWSWDLQQQYPWVVTIYSEETKYRKETWKLNKQGNQKERKDRHINASYFCSKCFSPFMLSSNSL